MYSEGTCCTITTTWRLVRLPVVGQDRAKQGGGRKGRRGGREERGKEERCYEKVNGMKEKNSNESSTDG